MLVLRGTVLPVSLISNMVYANLQISAVTVMQVVEGSQGVLSCRLPPECPCWLRPLRGGFSVRATILRMGFSAEVLFITIDSVYCVRHHASLGHFHICRYVPSHIPSTFPLSSSLVSFVPLDIFTPNFMSFIHT